MKVTFTREADFIAEANSILFRYYGGETLEVLHERMKQRSEYDETMEKTLQALEKMYSQIVNQITLPHHIASYFEGFDKENPISVCLADCILYEGFNIVGDSFDTLGALIKKKFHEDDTHFMHSVLNVIDVSTKDMDETQFMQELEQLNTTDAVKWNVWRVYKNFDEHVDILLAVILEMIPVMKKVYGKYYNQFECYYDYWEKACDKGTFFDKINDTLHFALEADKEVVARPLFMECNTMRLVPLTRDYANVLLQIGVIFARDKIFEQKRFTKEELCSRLKLLGDTSKYEILKSIKDERMYGVQLAEKLGLSSATISHHISTLTSLGFIMIENDANRVYYRLNKSQLEITIEQLKNELLSS